MKKTALLLSVLFLLATCTPTKELSGTKAENRKIKKLAEQVVVKKAVESRKYVITVNKFYSTGQSLDLIPRNNFLIINGEFASISLFYSGRSYTSRPIAGINLNGKTTNYKMESNEAKGMYNIEMEVKAGFDKFDVYLSIGNTGFCTISINNANIQTVNYYGTLVPLADQKNVPDIKSERI
jgi:hypothetical protein